MNAADLWKYYQAVAKGTAVPIGMPPAPQLGQVAPVTLERSRAALAVPKLATAPGAAPGALDGLAGWLSMPSLFGLPRWLLLAGAGAAGYYFATKGKP